jgi:hypothetical protein
MTTISINPKILEKLKRKCDPSELPREILYLTGIPYLEYAECINVSPEEFAWIIKNIQPRKLSQDEITKRVEEIGSGSLDDLSEYKCYKLKHTVIHLLNNNEPFGEKGTIVWVVRYKHDDYFTVKNLEMDESRQNLK